MERVEVAVIGAGSVGIAVAYYLVRDHCVRNVALLDGRDPMAGDTELAVTLTEQHIENTKASLNASR